jgi:soluble lytic murein transglycosylase-like protein
MKMAVFAVCLALVWSGGTAYAQPALERTHAEAVYYADAYADHYNVPRELVHAIITQESNWRPDAISRKGAIGIMQLMPATAARLGVSNVFSVADNIGGGVRYLAELMQKFSGDLRLVVAAYYAGSHRLEKRRLSYSNSAVHAYVVSVRRLYHEEMARHGNSATFTYIPGETQ